MNFCSCHRALSDIMKISQKNNETYGTDEEELF
jgi:hypothetical protein